MSWIVEGFKEPKQIKIVFHAEAQYLIDVFAAVRDATSLNCSFISVIRKKQRSNLATSAIPHGVCVDEVEEHEESKT